MRRFGLVLTAAAAVCLVISLSGCDSADEITLPSDAILQDDIQTGTDAAAQAGPAAFATGDMIFGMMDLVAPALPATHGGLAPAVEDCSGPFELESGVSGSCSETNGVTTFTFSGTVDVDGHEVSVSGTMTATESQYDAETGNVTYAIDYSVSASGPNGSASWNAAGVVTVNAEEGVVDYDVTMTHTVTTTGGDTVTVTTTVSPTSFVMVLTGPRGGVVRFVMNIETGEGMASWNGINVAEVSFVEGCINIDYLNPEIEDQLICDQDA